MEARRKLDQWRRSAELTQRDLARRLEVDESWISRVLAGQKRPGLDLAAAIETMTGGWVRASEWVQRGRARSRAA